MTMTPYREPREDEDRIAIAADELVIDTPSAERRAAFVRMLAIVGSVTTVAIVALQNVTLDVLVIVLAGTYSVFHASRIGARGRVVIRIEHDALVLTRGREPEITIALHTLEDVELETREIRKVGPDANPIAGLSFNQHVAPAVDVARVVIMQRKAPEVRLGEDWISHTDASDAFRRLRLFLRARGWIPRGERQSAK